MVMQPLVSVIMPSFNSRDTLPRAMASVTAQTCEDWECVFVDDGSTDGSYEWMREIADPRFRCLRSAVNRGRGAARQLALDTARGRYLAMLDADDWYYPQKLQRELDCIAADPGIALVSASLAIVDPADRLAGIRRSKPHDCSMAGTNWTSVCFAPSLIRMEVARQVGFDCTYRVGEDRDFLLRLLPGRAYTCLPETLYAYTEYASATLEKVLESNRSAQRRANQLLAHDWIRRQSLNLSYYGKSFLYRAAFALGQQERMVRARSEHPQPADLAQFEAAWAVVESVRLRCFGPEGLETRPQAAQRGSVV